MMNSDQHVEHFPIEVVSLVKGQTQHLAILWRIKTHLKLHTIRNQPSIQQTLQENQLCLKRHHWNFHDSNTVQPFNILGINPRSVYSDNVINEI